MPTTILHKESLIPGRTSKLVLDAPQIAATAKPGHFVMLRVNEQGERFPLTIADTDPEKGTITIVYLVMRIFFFYNCRKKLLMTPPEHPDVPM